MLNTSKIYNFSLFLIVILFSFLVNVYYSSFGVEPMDSFVLYNGGYKVLNNLVPFIDYWLVTGPLMDYLNAFFFKILTIKFCFDRNFYYQILSKLNFHQNNNFPRYRGDTGGQGHRSDSGGRAPSLPAGQRVKNLDIALAGPRFLRVGGPS